MADLLLAIVALLVLVVAVVVLLKGEGLGRTRVGFAIAVIVLATGVFAVTLYRSQSSAGETKAAPARTGVVQQIGAAVFRIDVPTGHGDKQPQGALFLDPPRVGTDAYTGDVSLGCYTPTKNDSQQHCTGSDKRVWTVSAIGKKATMGVAVGDPFSDPTACDENRGVTYQSGYVQLDLGKNYCLRRSGGGTTVALRVVTFGGQQPLPTDIVVDAAVVTG